MQELVTMAQACSLLACASAPLSLSSASDTSVRRPVVPLDPPSGQGCCQASSFQSTIKHSVQFSSGAFVHARMTDDR
jgi:hypothetical protein